jgi:hypothetical protein
MEVERTLVKSPPELWAEVSDLEALARHLAEFGEIAITRVEPESKVAWEGEHASGTVELTASGWGTKVRLTAKVEEAVAQAEPAPEVEPEEEPLPAAVVDEPEVPEEPVAASADIPVRRRWLRLWRRRPEPVVEDPPVVAEIPGPPGPPAPDPAPPTPTPEPGPPAPPDPNPPQIGFDPERTQALLTQVLDDLGQAHHRPFSRS